MWKFLLGLRPRQLVAGLRPRQLVAGLRPRQLVAGLRPRLIIVGLTLPLLSHAFEPNTLVFLGSSSMEYWKTLGQDFKPRPTLNLGVGGTTYTYLLQHAADYAAKYPAQEFVIYSGDNDLELKVAPSGIARQCKELAGILHGKLPSAKLLVISVKPSPARSKNLALVKETNELLRAAAQALGYVTFVDVVPAMTDAKGAPRPELFRADGLHMNEKGYRIWVKAVKKAL